MAAPGNPRCQYRRQCRHRLAWRRSLPAGGTAFITNATISGNQASDPTANGGGIYQSSDDNLTLTNVTLVNNQAGMLGGGFYHYGRYAILTNVTIGNNQAGAAGMPSTRILRKHLPARRGADRQQRHLRQRVNCDGGLFQSLGHNISKGTCTALSDPSDQDNYAGDLRLDGLAFNGGAFPMRTLLPLTGSPVINAGDTTLARRPINAAPTGSAYAISAPSSTAQRRTECTCRWSCADHPVQSS